MNVAGRDPEGVVPENEYETVRTELVELLSDLETPDGKPAFEDVAPRQAYFHGPETDEAVDIVLVPRAFDQFLSTQLRETVFGPPTEPWNHKREGIVAATGEGIDSEKSLSGAHLFDVAPTVLATLGVERGDHMDGAVLDVVESVGDRSYPEPKHRARETTDERAVEARLGDLGYLE